MPTEVKSTCFNGISAPQKGLMSFMNLKEKEINLVSKANQPS